MSDDVGDVQGIIEAFHIELSGLRARLRHPAVEVPMLRGAEWFDWLTPQPGGIVFDEGEARVTPCERITLPGGSQLVYSRGIIGALNEQEKALYCPEMVDSQLSTAQAERIESFQRAAHECEQEARGEEKGISHLEGYLGCMHKRLKEQHGQLASEGNGVADSYEAPAV